MPWLLTFNARHIKEEHIASPYLSSIEEQKNYYIKDWNHLINDYNKFVEFAKVNDPDFYNYFHPFTQSKTICPHPRHYNKDLLNDVGKKCYCHYRCFNNIGIGFTEKDLIEFPAKNKICESIALYLEYLVAHFMINTENKYILHTYSLFGKIIVNIGDINDKDLTYNLDELKKEYKSELFESSCCIS
jgi:hypothetical protein